MSYWFYKKVFRYIFTFLIIFFKTRFFYLTSSKTIVSCLPCSIFFVLSKQMFFSVHWNSGYSFGEGFSFLLDDYTFNRGKESLDIQCIRGKFFFDKAIFIDDFWRRVTFEKLLNIFGLFSFRKCKFSSLKYFLRKICSIRTLNVQWSYVLITLLIRSSSYLS